MHIQTGNRNLTDITYNTGTGSSFTVKIKMNRTGISDTLSLADKMSLKSKNLITINDKSVNIECN
jgi:hypothetical protein